jgi:hypothetical protein
MPTNQIERLFYNNIPSKLVTILAKLKSMATLCIDSSLFVPRGHAFIIM